MNTPIHARSIMQLRRILTLYNIYMVRQVEMFSYIFSSSLIGQSISISLYPLYTAYNSFGNFFRWLICRQHFRWPFSLLENLDGGRLIQIAGKLTIRISLSICRQFVGRFWKIPPWDSLMRDVQVPMLSFSLFCSQQFLKRTVYFLY